MTPIQVKRGLQRGRAAVQKTGRAEKTEFSNAVPNNVEKKNRGDDSQEENSNSDAESLGSTSEEEDEEAPPFQSYSLLLQAFQAEQKEDRPAKKRRKLNNRRTESTDEVANSPSQQPLEEPLEDEEDFPVDEASAAEEEGFDIHASDDEEDTSDPFEAHFGQADEALLKRCIRAAEERDWDVQRAEFGDLGSCLRSRLKPAVKPNEATKTVGAPKGISYLKKRLVSTAQSQMPQFGSFQQALVPNVFEYRDILFGARKVSNSEGLRDLACLHALNHVMKTRDRVLKNNARFSREQDDGDLDIRDQGFTRPKVLFLLETRQTCARYIESITALSEPEQQENKKRFLDSFASKEQRFGEDKPEDFRELFEGNDDNAFRLGIKFTRKTMKFFSKFYASDMIFASPLGLRRAIGAMNEEEESKKRDYDFLSSIELVIVDQADAMLMQNWEHVEYIFEHLNQQPKGSHDTDFSRVRHWYLDGNAKFLRQTIVFSAFLTPDLNALSSRHMCNIAGKIKYQPRYAGAIASLDFPFEIKQSFSRFYPKSHMADPDARFNYFTTAVVQSLLRLPKSANESGQGILIFVPSYFDFVRVRNYFSTSTDTTNISFGVISEYTPPADVRRARAHFISGRYSVLMYTERAHHFRRYRLKGVKRVIMYSLPENPIFYREIVGGFLQDSALDGKVRAGEGNVRVIFSKFDALKLERVVGSKRVQAMVSAKTEGDTFDFA